MTDTIVTRRLTTIVAADVAGYSRLVGADEEGTFAALRAHRLELLDPKIAEHRGRIANTAGDSILIEFPSVVEALRCAVDIQIGMVERNLGISEDRQICFRIGINAGDIIEQDGDILGDGVNVAARLEGLAPPGGIAVSSTVREHVGNKLNLMFEDIGEHLVKNITKPVRIYMVRWLEGDSTIARSTDAIAKRPAVAVLPFANMSGDPEQEYFSDGLTEDIINALAHWRSFPVIARNSTFAYKNRSIDIVQAGRELGARYLLEGSVRKSRQRIRITAQLIDGSTGHHIWAERYDRQLDDIFEVQDEITQRITATIAPELVKVEFKRSIPKRPEHLDSWDLCLRGMALIRHRTSESNAEARVLFQRAIAIQPDYSDAYSGLANTYHIDILLQNTNDRMATATLAMEAARLAVGFDESSSYAHHALSTAYQWLNRHDDALREARIAVELNPNDATGLHALGNKSDLAGVPEGISLMEKAQRLNPQDAQLHSHLTFLARAYVNIGSYEEALDRAQKAVERGPDYPHAYYILAIALGYLGRINDGLDALNMCEKLHPGFVALRENWQPYVDPNSNESLREGLRTLRGETAG